MIAIEELKQYEKPFTKNAPVADGMSRTVGVKKLGGARSERKLQI